MHALDAATGEQRWRYVTGSAVAFSPAEVGNAVYVSSPEGGVYALDATTGEVHWYTETDETGITSPILLDNAVYASSGNGQVYALDAVKGDVLWRIKLDDHVTAPAIHGDVIYVGSNKADSKASRVHALSRETGEILWQFEADDQVQFSSPPVVDGDTVYVVSYWGPIFALDAANGEEQWRSRARSRVWYSPAVQDGVVYVSGERGYVSAFDAATGSELWQFRTESAASSSLANGKQASGLYSSVSWTEILSGPAVADGVVYVGSLFGFVFALDAATGIQLWRQYGTGGVLHLPPKVIDGVVYVGSRNGWVQALDALTGEIYWSIRADGSLWDFQSTGNGALFGIAVRELNPGFRTVVYALNALPPATPLQGKLLWSYPRAGESLSPPVLHDGVVYLRSFSGRVIALDAANGKHRLAISDRRLHTRITKIRRGHGLHRLRRWLHVRAGCRFGRGFLAIRGGCELLFIALPNSD